MKARDDWEGQRRLGRPETTGKEANTIHLLPNISRSKNKQLMKFDQLIKNNMRYIFLRKSCRKWDRGTSSTPLFCLLKKLYMK